MRKDVNASNERKNSRLHWACLNGRIKVIKKLILAGASLSIQNWPSLLCLCFITSFLSTCILHTSQVWSQNWDDRGHGVVYYCERSGMPEEEILNQQEMRSAFSKAFQSWEGASQFRLQQVPDGSSANFVIGFYRGDHRDDEPFDGPGMVLPHSYFPEDGRTHYDANQNWSTNPASNQIDLQSVAVHEIDHLLGLAHTSVPQAIMYSGLPPGTIKRGLTQDDIGGIRALYSN